MLIDFKKAVAKYRMNITGVIHVGAHYGQEYSTYRELGITPILFIEPCQKAFQVLRAAFADILDVHLFQSACGSEFAIGTMNVEEANKGMSNSLLKPAKHLQQYPSIQFTNTEEVEIHMLDEIVNHLVPFRGNLLVMDVQGYELNVIRGALGTLGTMVDYIYTEVNRDEVYEGCAKVWELDEWLKGYGFTRVETSWAGGTWGDAIYIKNITR